MEKSKKFRMPAGIRNKLTAAVAMLLVSSIMMVSSTYAWFTLSTAPEVTGITTSVGANGNLEMALLNGQTFADMTKIGSGVGDSSAATNDLTESNITWGNLVDLSAAGYGLNLIALNPAALNMADGKVGTTLLKTAEYGADGRVADLKDNTITGVYNSTNSKWVTTQTFDGDATVYDAYGVRAIGVDSSMTTAQIVFNAAVSAVNSGVRGASSAVSGAVRANSSTFMLLAMSMQGGGEANYTAADYAALKAVAEGVQTSLNTIVKTYANAVLAKLAVTEGVTDDVLTDLRGKLSNMTSASELSTVLSGASVTNDYTTALTTLAAAQGEVATILSKFTVSEGVVGTTATDVKEEIVKPLIGSSVKAYGADGQEVAISGSDLGALASASAMHLIDGLVADVAAEAGTYEMCNVTGIANVTVYAGAKDATTGNLAAVKTTVDGLTPPSGENAETTIADFYGYVIDFAFRTNAASSNLQLQTSAVNRVYSDAEGENLATQGSGSTATFVFDSSLLNETQVNALLSAINLVFLNPADGTVYGTAKLTEVVVTGGEATAKVKMEGQDGDVATIVALAQNQATKVSVLVYMNGYDIDNADVANSTSSGMLNLNLQFSSSAELIPMQNTALENLVAYTVTFNANGGFGFMPAVKASGDYAVPNNTFTAPAGKIFKGWAKTATIAADTDLVTTLTLEENVTLYAIWEDDPNAGVQEPETQTYTVSFNANYPGSAVFADDENAVKTVADVSVDTETYNLPANSFTAPDGYEFGGWIVNGTGEAQAAGTPIPVEGDIALTAVWNPIGG